MIAAFGWLVANVFAVLWAMLYARRKAREACVQELIDEAAAVLEIVAECEWNDHMSMASSYLRIAGQYYASARLIAGTPRQWPDPDQWVEYVKEIYPRPYNDRWQV